MVSCQLSSVKQLLLVKTRSSLGMVARLVVYPLRKPEINLRVPHIFLWKKIPSIAVSW